MSLVSSKPGSAGLGVGSLLRMCETETSVRVNVDIPCIAANYLGVTSSGQLQVHSINLAIISNRMIKENSNLDHRCKKTQENYR